MTGSPGWVKIPRTERRRLVSLLSGGRDSYLWQAVLEGYQGEAWADDRRAPQAAHLVMHGIHRFGGDPSRPGASERVAEVPRHNGVWPSGENWQTVCSEALGPRLRPIERHDLASDALDRARLVSLFERVPQGYSLARMQLAHAKRVGADVGSRDHVAPLGTTRDFMRLGFGFCVTQGERIVSAATTFAVCASGIEIQVNTHPAHRRKGLAAVAAAALVAHALDRGLDPHWDAANRDSVRLAEKLGYVYRERYTMWVVV